MNGKEFMGRGLRFPLQIDPKTGKFAMVSAEEDIAEAIAFFATERSGFITGQVLTADGGFIL